MKKQVNVLCYITNIIIQCIPILAAVITVYWAEYFARKRDFQQKRMEIQLEYLKKNLDLLTGLENDMFILSRRVDSCLSKSINNNRRQEYNSIIGDMSRINEKILSYGYMLNCFNKSMKININIEDHKRCFSNYVDKLHEIFNEYIEQPNTEEANATINKIQEEARQQLHIEIESITSIMASLLKVQK